MRFVSLSLFILPAAAETKPLMREILKKTFSLFPHLCVKVIDDTMTTRSPTTTISSSSSHRSLCNRNVRRGVFHHHFPRARKTRRETNAAFVNAKNNSAKNNETTNAWERKRREKAKKSDSNEDDASPKSFLNRLRPPNPRRRQQQQQGKVAKGEVSCMERGNATVRAAKTFASENEKLALFVFVIQAVYIVVKTTKRMKKAMVFMKDRWRKLREAFEYVKENYAFGTPKVTRTAKNDPQFRSLLKDYAKLIHDLYDVPIVPECIETRVYAQALEQGLEGAFETLDDIVLSGDARVLGHPLVVQRRFVGEDSERLKTYGALEGSKEDELEKFVAEVVENTNNNNGENSSATSKLLQKMEKKMSKKILSIAARTGTLFLESGVQSFSARIFDAEFYFDVREQVKEEGDDTSLRERREALRRRRAIQIAKTASDERLGKVIEELQIPPIGILFPELERDVGRLVIAMACEAIDSEVSLPNVDYAVKFNLRVKDQKEYDEDERKRNKQKTISSSSSDDADELAQALADDFMTRRKAVAPMFITPELERKTYVDIIKGILGEIGLNAPSVIAEFLGMDVTIQVIRKKNDDKKLKLRKEEYTNDVVGITSMNSDSTNDAFTFLRERFNMTPIVAKGKENGETRTTSLSSSSSSSTSTTTTSNRNAINRESVEAFIDWLLADAAYNVQAIPDDVERALYANCFELFLDAFLETTQKVEFSILSRTVKIRTRVAKDAPRDYTKIRRFRPDWQALDSITEEIKIEPEALKKITSNVHAFALAFLSQILEDASAVICGHEIRLALTTPTVLRKSYDFDDVDVSFDGTARMSVDYNPLKSGGSIRSFASSKALREPSRKSAQNTFSAMDALNALATELAMEASSALVSENKGFETSDNQSNGGDFSIDSIFADLQRDLQKQIAQFGFKNSFANASQLDSDAISHDAVAFSVFKKHCSPPDETFPFPYLTKAQFEVASLEVIKMAGFRNASKSITEKMEALANAADEDKNGVIQWGEWYCVSDAIISAVEKAKVQSSRK